MYVDSQLQFASAQALTADAPSQNIVDFKDARDIGVGESLYVVVVVTANLTGTLQVNIETDDNEAFASPAVKADIGSLALNAAAGSALIYKLSPDVMDEQYARLDLNGVTAGSVSAFMTKDIQKYVNYASGFVVS